MATSKKTTKPAADKKPVPAKATPAKSATAKKAPAPKAPAKKEAPAKAKETKVKKTPVAAPAPEPEKTAKATKKATPKAEPKAAAKKPTAKAEPKAAAKKPTAKAEPKPTAKKPTAKVAPKPEPEPVPAPEPQPAPKPAPEPKPKKPKKPNGGTSKPKGTDGKTKNAKTDALTPEEKARLAKYKATRALLKADPEWPAFLAAQKELLLDMRDRLLPNMQNVTRDHLRSGASNVSSASGQHIGDAGSEAEVRDLTIRLLDKDREQLFEIDAALERIRLGHYGICEISLDPIPKKRLQVRPACRLTVKCQEEYEKKYGSYANYKAQNSDNVGFSGLQNAMESIISLDDAEE